MNFSDMLQQDITAEQKAVVFLRGKIVRLNRDIKHRHSRLNASSKDCEVMISEMKATQQQRLIDRPDRTPRDHTHIFIKMRKDAITDDEKSNQRCTAFNIIDDAEIVKIYGYIDEHNREIVELRSLLVDASH